MVPTARAEHSTIGRNQPAGQSQQTQKRTSSGQNQQHRAKTRATSAPSFGAPHRPPLQHADSSRHKKRESSWLTGGEREELNEDASGSRSDSDLVITSSADPPRSTHSSSESRVNPRQSIAPPLLSWELLVLG